MQFLYISTLWLAASASWIFLAASAPGAAPAPRPNIVFILADDLGWSDVGFHGQEINTPHLDRLAAEGARLEQFYVQPVCSPTRASLMTGRYPLRYGLQVGVVRPYAQYGLPLEEKTLAQGLRDAGYTTAICGKWHLGHFRREYLPGQRGFQHQYGHYNGALDYWTHIRDGGLDWHRDDKPLREEGYTTDLVTAEAVRLIERQPADKPLFLYVPYNAVHAPLEAPEAYLKRYKHIADKNRRTYAAMTTCMDDGIGKIVTALDQRGLRKNTLIIFCSDNGGPLQLGATNGPLRAGKGTLYEGGVRVPALAVWPGVIAPNPEIRGLMHMVDWYPTLLQLAGAKVTSAGPLDGVDQWPMLAEGKPSARTEILHNITPAEGAIRVGDWKLIVRFGPEEEPVDTKKAKKKQAQNAEPVQLFKIAEDPNEKTNRAAAEPAKVAELRQRLDAYARAAVPPKAKPGDLKGKAPAVWGDFPD